MCTSVPNRQDRQLRGESVAISVNDHRARATYPTPVHVPPAADGMRLRTTERARYNDYEYVFSASVQ